MINDRCSPRLLVVRVRYRSREKNDLTTGWKRITRKERGLPHHLENTAEEEPAIMEVEETLIRKNARSNNWVGAQGENVVCRSDQCGCSAQCSCQHLRKTH